MFHVRASEEYRLRHSVGPDVVDPTAATLSPDETDHDVRLLLEGQAASPGSGFRLSSALALCADVDGSVPEHVPSGVGSMYGTPDQTVWFDVFSLFAELRSETVLKRASLGRQTAEYGPRVTFDGALVEFAVARNLVDVFLFGGRTHHFFEIDADLFEDWIGSGGVAIRPTRDLRLELDYRFQREDVAILTGTGATEEIPVGTGQPPLGSVSDHAVRDTVTDHTYGLQAWYRPAAWVAMRGHVRGLRDTLISTGLDLHFTMDSIAAGAIVQVEAQPATLDEINESNNSFTALLGPSLPHARGHIQLWKVFATSVGDYGVHVGWRDRLLLSDEPTRFNREHGAAYVMALAQDISGIGLYANVVGEAHFDHTGDSFFNNTLMTVGGALGWQSDTLRAEAGTAFQRYRYDYFQDVDEVANVRTLYVEGRYVVQDGLDARVRYQLDQFDRDQHTAWITATQTY